ncbi:MAG: hypothetical protein AB1529_00495 [Candidatus Micrarchaeota archaeon]
MSFIVPVTFRGIKDCALVVEHPDFDMVGMGGNTYELRADESSFHLLEHFPGSRPWHCCYDEKFRIPVGPALIDGDGPTRTLLRADGSYIGSLARVVYSYSIGGVGRDVLADVDWSKASGVALF